MEDAVAGQRGDPDGLSRKLFAGELVLFSGIAALEDLIAHVRALVEGAFGQEPQSAETRLSAEAFLKTAARARRLVADNERAGELWQQTLEDIGYARDEVHSDRMRLRVVPSQPQAASRFVRVLPPHRDSWGSSIQCQINWWAPLYPLSETRTMLIWPDAFTRPVENTSPDWDYEVLISRAEPDYPLLPEATEEPPGQALPVAIAPGELLAFSAAHLHASVSDMSGLTRFSLDTRSIWDADIGSGRGAPNVDGADRPPRWEMFDRAGLQPAHPPKHNSQGAP